MRLLFLCAVAAYGQDVAKLSWMAGSWTGTRGRASIEEHWTQPNGNAMLAVSKTVVAGKMVEFEFLRVVVKDGAIVYVAQPSGRPPTDFKLTASTDKEAVFENPQHDFPKLVRYKRDGDKLTASIEGNGKKIEFQFQRSTP
jgi:hypothetical protein